jgi:biotin/methionine sulfoxide reductase
MFLPHSSHWGAFSARWDDGHLDMLPHPDDPAPAELLGNLAAAPRHPSRILRPLVRRGWLNDGPGSSAKRGEDTFVEMDWEGALDLLAADLDRVRAEHSIESIFGGSYGWSSAGRFHHAQSQVHRFLNTALGGYVRSHETYSSGAAAVILPRVVAPLDRLNRRSSTWNELAETSECVLVFGGMPLRNAMVSAGGISAHIAAGALRHAKERGCEFIHVSPLRDDLPEWLGGERLAIRPATDTAIMIAIAHTLLTEQLLDRGFIDKYTTGFEAFADYLVGRADGQSKDAEWAASICRIDPETIRRTARSIAGRRTLVTVSYGLQRSQYGEQPIWMAVVLAAMLGQIGLPGGGFAIGLGSIGNVGRPPLAVPIPTLPQGRNQASGAIPVARVADMLLNPGAAYQFNGEDRLYPDIKLVYWAGGNPFHHHQDLARLAQAFRRPETVVVHEPFFTATARFADIVLPTTITLERNDIGAARNDPKLIAMHKVVEPVASARNDFDIFADLADRLGRRDAFTENRTTFEWLTHLYETTRRALVGRGLEVPDFDAFWQRGEIDLPLSTEPDLLSEFRRDPDINRLPTPSGLIEVSSDTIASFGYDDCGGHPAWRAPDEWLGGSLAERFPLQLISNQPSTRLHSQLDFGSYSQNGKIAGREKLRMNPADASDRGITSGDVVRVFNDRGSCLAGVEVDGGVSRRVVQLSTGAWYDPRQIAGIGLVCVNGNPNAVTRDAGTSRLAQACSGQLCLVDIERFAGEVPSVRAYELPETCPAE